MRISPVAWACRVLRTSSSPTPWWKKIRRLNKRLDIPASFKEAGVSEELFNSTADFISEHAVEDPCTGANPRETDVANMKKVLTCAYYGEDVTF